MTRRTAPAIVAIGVLLGLSVAGAVALTSATSGSADVQPSPRVQPSDPGVTFEDQDSDGRTVTVDRVRLPDGGFVVIHDTSLRDGDAVGSVIGVSAYLGPGTYEDVSVRLFDVPGAQFDRDELTRDQTLIAMPHRDDTGNQRFDFVRSDGDQDPPYTGAGGNPITDAAYVTIDGDGDGNGDGGGDGDGDGDRGDTPTTTDDTTTSTTTYTTTYRTTYTTPPTTTDTETPTTSTDTETGTPAPGGIVTGTVGTGGETPGGGPATADEGVESPGDGGDGIESPGGGDEEGDGGDGGES